MLLFIRGCYIHVHTFHYITCTYYYNIDLTFIIKLILMVLACEHLIRYPLVLITVYNAVDLASRYIPLVKCLTMESRKGLMTGILLRMLFVPAFYFTAKYGDLGWMMMLTSLLGFSNGYFTVCVMIVAPRGYQVSTQCAFVIL